MWKGTESELTEWALKEWEARTYDLAAMRDGHLTLDEVKDRAKRRRLAVGLTMSQASSAVIVAQREQKWAR